MIKLASVNRKHIVPAVTAIGLAVIVVPIFLSRSDPITILEMKLTQDEFTQGSKVVIVYRYKKNKECRHNTLYVQIYDQAERVRMYEGELSFSVDIPDDNGPDIYSGMTKYIGLPEHTAPGKGVVHPSLEFRCNFIHEWWPIVVDLPPIEFTIKGRVPTEKLKEEIDEIKKSQPLVVPAPQPVPQSFPMLPQELQNPPFRSVPFIYNPAQPSPDKKIFKQAARRRKDRIKYAPKSITLSAPASTVSVTSAPVAPVAPQPKEDNNLPGIIKYLMGD